MTRTPRLTLPLVLMAWLLAQCASPDQNAILSTWPDGTSKEVHRTLEDGAVEVQQFHANGQIHIRGMLVDSVRQGTWNTYRENGLPWSQVAYVDGEKDGLFRTWHDNGMPHVEGQHEGGQPTGVWHFFDVEGQTTETRDFSAAN